MQTLLENGGLVSYREASMPVSAFWCAGRDGTLARLLEQGVIQKEFGFFSEIEQIQAEFLEAGGGAVLWHTSDS